MSSSEDRLRAARIARLKRAGAKYTGIEMTDKDIESALAKHSKQEREKVRERDRARREKVKSQDELLRVLLAHYERNLPRAHSAVQGTAAGGNPIDSLAGIRDEIVRATVALTRATEKTKIGTDGDSLSSSIDGLQRTVGYMIWILCVGTGIVAAGMAVLVVQAIWSMLPS